MSWPITEIMRERMLAYCESQIRVYFGDGTGLLKTDRYQRSIRVLLLRLIPLMTQRFHRVSDFMDVLPLAMSEAPEIVADILSGRHDYSFGYHSTDIPFTFHRVP
jgi:hypothetical protein